MTADSNNNKTIWFAIASRVKPAPHQPDEEPAKYFRQYRCVWFNFGRFQGRAAMAKFTINPEGEITTDEVPGDTSIEAMAKQKAGPPTKKEEQDIISLRQFDARISDEAAAVAFAEEQRWGDGLYCPKCGLDSCYRVKSGKPQPFRCRDCKKYFSVRVGTPMENSNLPIQTWLKAIHLILTARKGVSALQMQKHLGVDYRTAWFLDHRIREAMKQKLPPMTGIIQIDETWIGGKVKNIHKSKKKADGWTWKSNKTVVIGLRQEDGTVIAFPVPDTYAETLQNAVLDHVKPGSTVWSDEQPSYKPLPGYGYIHEWITHGSGEYVKDMVTTNGIESFWALLKRGYIGTFHYMSWKHLHRYVNEFTYRQNVGKGNGFETIGAVLKNMEDRQLSYEKLTGRKIGAKKGAT